MNDDDFHEALGRATLEAERSRHTILAGLLTAACAIALTALTTQPELVARISHGSVAPRFVPVLLGIFIAYELVMRRRTMRALVDGRPPSALARYINALIESTFPSIAIGMVALFTSFSTAILAVPGVLYFVFIALSGLRLDFRLSLFTGVCSAVQYAALAAVALTLDNSAIEPVLISVPSLAGRVVMLLVASVITGVVGARVRAAVSASLKTLADKQRVVDLFGQQVSAAVVEKLLSQPEMKSELRHVCVMFLDIRDFTSFSEKRRPEEVVAYLNALWSFMIDIVNAHGGIINKFLGDGFMATFGAPVSSGADCKHAVLAAKEMLARVVVEQQRGSIPPTRIGIGLHAGEAVTGNIGGLRRKEYSVIGDVVNVASRIESLNKPHAAQLLVSEDVCRGAIEETAGATSLGPITVKGREQPVQVFKLA